MVLDGLDGIGDAAEGLGELADGVGEAAEAVGDAIGGFADAGSIVKGIAGAAGNMLDGPAHPDISDVIRSPYVVEVVDATVDGLVQASGTVSEGVGKAVMKTPRKRSRLFYRAVGCATLLGMAGAVVAGLFAYNAYTARKEYEAHLERIPRIHQAA